MIVCSHLWSGLLTSTAALGVSWGAFAAEPAADAKPARPAQAAEKAAPLAADEAPKDPFAVPNGSPQEILDWLDGLANVPPPGPDPQALAAFQQRLYGALLQASDKILAGKPNERQAQLAVRLKINALLTLRRLGLSDTTKRLETLPAELETSGRAPLARLARRVLLGNRIQHLVRGGPAELGQAVAELKQHIGDKPEAEDAELVLAVAELAEMIDRRSAGEVYTHFGKVFAANKDPQLAKLGARMAGSARRLSLVGQTMPLEGKLLGGQALDWKSYRGKVVLVVFWATWCGPCREELPEIQQLHADYRQRGFDVVSISLDSEREPLEAFVKDAGIVWSVMFDDAVANRGFDHPMAIRYGVSGIPSLALLDKQGKCLVLDPRGPQIREEVAKLLGPLPTVKATELKGPGLPP